MYSKTQQIAFGESKQSISSLQFNKQKLPLTANKKSLAGMFSFSFPIIGTGSYEHSSKKVHP